MTPSGIEPATFRFVAQRLKHCANFVSITQGVLVIPYRRFGTTYSTIFNGQESKLILHAA